METFLYVVSDCGLSLKADKGKGWYEINKHLRIFEVWGGCLVLVFS